MGDKAGFLPRAAFAGLTLATIGGAAAVAVMFMSADETEDRPVTPAPPPPPATGYTPFYHPRILPRYRGLPEGGVRARFVTFRPSGSNAVDGLEVDDPLRIAQAGLVLSAEARELYDRLDGRPLDAVRKEVIEGMEPGHAAEWSLGLQRLVQSLDENFLLENARFGAEVLRRIQAFGAAEVREAIAIGRVRRSSIDSILATGKPCPARALVVPHIDYDRGGMVYAAAYGAWKGRARPARVVVLGTSHARGAHYFALTRKSFRTPLGEVPADTAFIDRLTSACRRPLFIDEYLHRDEHSIELQIPFLQALFGQVPIVPVLCGSLLSVSASTPMREPEIADFVAALAKCIGESKGETLIVAGSDLSHLGRYFGDVDELGPELLAEVEAADRALLERSADVDAEGLFEAVRRGDNPRRICGGAPLVALASLLKMLGGGRGRVAAYRQCSDRAGERMVSIGAVIFD